MNVDDYSVAISKLLKNSPEQSKVIEHEIDKVLAEKKGILLNAPLNLQLLFLSTHFESNPDYLKELTSHVQSGTSDIPQRE